MTLAHKTDFQAIGTSWHIETVTSIADTLQKTIADRIEEFDRTYSRFRSDSLVTQVANNAGTYQFPDDAQKIILFYKDLYRLTDGLVTPLVGAMLERAGYDATYSFIPQPQLPLADWGDVMTWRENELTTTSPLTLDVGGAGKGYLIDILAELLHNDGHKEMVIDASGDIRHNGSQPQRIGLEHPLDTTKIIGMIDLRNQSICASATNRRSWGSGMHHIFNPKLKVPVRDIIATWAIADSALVADGIATALFLVNPEKLMKDYTFSYVRLHQNGAVDYSHNFRGELF